MPTTVAEISSGARTILRDFPLYFEVDQGPLNTLTIRLPHPLIAQNALTVYDKVDADTPAVTTSAWSLDARNGLLKITDQALMTHRILVSGYHYSWFLDSDLEFHAQQVYGEMSYYSDLPATLQPAQAEVIEYGTVVHALWSLAIELSLDIDVSTPEGMFIPARQRFSQILQMLGQFETEYNSKAALMNMGLGGLDQFRLRRVAYLTGRYVPVYKEREFDDPRPPERIYPQIPPGIPATTGISDVVESYREASG